MATARRVPHPYLKPAVFTGALVPAAAMVLKGFTHQLGANPIAAALNQLGLLTLIFLISALACTPLKWVAGWTWPLRLRRMLGLFAFAYAAAHVLTYVLADQALDWHAILEDILKRKFIFVGFAAFTLLVPLAVTSTNAMVKRLGFARWKLLHRLAYLATGLGALHFLLRVKKDLTEPGVYAGVVALLLAVRVVDAVRNARARAGKNRETGAAARS